MNSSSLVQRIHTIPSAHGTYLYTIYVRDSKCAPKLLKRHFLYALYLYWSTGWPLLGLCPLAPTPVAPRPMVKVKRWYSEQKKVNKFI